MSTVDCGYKVLSKVQKVLTSLIRESQAAYIGGKRIPDGVLVDNETMITITRSRVAVKD